MSLSIERRRLLKLVGLGSAAAMPVFRPGRAAAAEPGVPRRFACVLFQNGVPKTWWPSQAPTQSETPLNEVTFSKSLQPLEPFKAKTLLIRGLEDGGDGGHTNGWSTFSAYKGADSARPPVGAVTIDQHVTKMIGVGTKFPTGLQFSTPPMGSWHHAFTAGQGAIPSMSNPKAAFDRIFGTLAAPTTSGTTTKPTGPDPAELEALRLERKSVLDYISKELTAASGRLSGFDRQRMDAHLTSIREIEKRLSTDPAMSSLSGVSVGASCQNPTPVTFQTPSCKGDAGEAACKPLQDDIAKYSLEMMALALACDLARVTSFQFGGTADGTTYPWLPGSKNPELSNVVSGDVIRGHHGASHAESTPAAKLWLEEITQYHQQLMAGFYAKLESFKQADGRSLLDHSVTFVGNECGNGASHQHNNIPVTLVGGAGGKLKTGRFINYPEQPAARPIADLLVTLANIFGSPVTTYGNLPAQGAPPSRGIPYAAKGSLMELIT